MMSFSRKPFALLICIFAGFLLAVGCALVILPWQLGNRIHDVLEQQLPDAVESGMQSRINQPGELEQLQAKLNANLHNLKLQQMLPLVDKLLIQIDSLDVTPKTHNAQLLSWKTGDQQRKVFYHWDYDIAWLPLIFTSFALALVFTAIYYATPRPLAVDQRRWFSWLIARGISIPQARLLTAGLQKPLPLATQQWFEQLVEQMDFADALLLAKEAATHNTSLQNLPWLMASWKQHPAQISLAIEAANAPLALEFDLSQQQLRIHHMLISVAQTPLFYYLWYALQREAGDGWLLNPSSQQADMTSAKALVELMRNYHGHPKAIAELEEHGLRAKTLDQNRSKIKEAFCSALGDELAAEFLFESEKDMRTGRSRYRLIQSLPISIVAASTAAKSSPPPSPLSSSKTKAVLP